MHVGAVQDRGRRRHRGARQGDRSSHQAGHQSASIVSTRQATYLFASARRARLDAIPTFDDIGLEGDGPRAAVQLQEKTAGIAQNGAGLIAAPEGRGARRAVLADGLEDVSSKLVRHYRLR